MKTSKGELKKLMKEALREVLKEELKTILQEAVFSKGALSDIIAESVRGVSKAKSGQQRRSRTMQESQTQQRSKSPQKENKSSVSKLGENFKKMFNGKDITEGTQPLKEGGTPSTPTQQPQQSIPGGGGGGDQTIQQLEQQVRNMKGSGVQAQAMSQNPANQRQLQQQQQGRAQQRNPGEPDFNRDNPGGRMSARGNKELIEKLKSGERSSVMKGDN